MYGRSAYTRGRAYRVVSLPAAYSGRFVAENEGVNGVCKVLVGEDEEILGVHLLGNPASELIIQAGMMIEDRRKLFRLEKICLSTSYGRRNLSRVIN